MPYAVDMQLKAANNGANNRPDDSGRTLYNTYNIRTVTFPKSFLNRSKDSKDYHVGFKDEKPLFYISKLKTNPSVKIAVSSTLCSAFIILLFLSWHRLSSIFFPSSSVISVYYFLRKSFWDLLIPVEIPKIWSDDTTLAPFTFHPLPLGSIKPDGWLEDELNLMANGLAGHEYDFYHIIHDSLWLGGCNEYSPLNEGVPYWLNGIIPLAYGLNDARLKQQIHNAISYILRHQQVDGWLGPENLTRDRDIWGRFPLFLALCQLVEADPYQYSHTVIPAMYKFLRLMHDMLLRNIGYNQFWGRVRYQDMLIALQWLYENISGNNEILLQNMYLLKTLGLSWADYYDQRFSFGDLDMVNPPITDTHPDFPFVHAVNVGQGLKAGAAIYRFTKEPAMLQSSRDAVNRTFSYHGDVAGSIIGDEREAGQAPNRGTELCATVETMYSFSYLYQVMGDNQDADHCELAAFNALPVAITSDHWARQYITLANQPFSRKMRSPSLFWNVGENGIVYGTDTNYPCCTVNMPQGLPKFLSASFVKVGSNGLGHALLSPAKVDISLSNGAHVMVHCKTNYPFSSILDYTVFASNSFTLYLRVPEWHIPAESSIAIEGSPTQKVSPDRDTGMTAIHLHAGSSKVRYTLSATIRTVARANSTVAIYHGPLLYALDVGQSMVPREAASATSQYPWQAYDHYIVNTRPWRIAIDTTTLEFHAAPPFTNPEERLQSPIWAPKAPPSFITGKGCEIDWPLLGDLPAPVPLPINGTRRCTGKVVDVVLRPYGSLKVHMAELPTIDLGIKR